jgi:hypothetical protein
LTDHVGVTRLIVLPRIVAIVNWSIAFNDQLRLCTVKVSDVVAKLVLPPELESQHLAVAEFSP